MSTVTQVLRVTDVLRTLVDRKRELDASINGLQTKGDRLVAERQAVNTAIAAKKTELRTVVAELE